MINSLVINNLGERIVSKTSYIKSKLDNQSYCKTNGQFARHLRLHNLTNREYYETYISGYTPLCYCCKPVTYYRDGKYAKSCGDPCCVGTTIKQVKSAWTDNRKLEDSMNKKKAALLKTPEQKKEALQKAKETFQLKYGVTWGSKLESQKEKSKLTKLERYGISSYNNSEQSASKNKNKSVEEKNIINEKRRKTNLELHGVANCFFKPGVKEKSATSNSKGKEFVLPSGKIVRLRGYEDLVISILLKSYNEDQLVIDDMLQQYQIPIFSYVNVNQHTAHYYPDIYIPSENKIIEVKSRWWWDGNGNPKHSSRLENNLRKRKAVIAKGYNYELWLYQDKKNYKILNDSNF